MMDDVVGLVMVQIVASLGSTESESSLSAATVVRPLLVSAAFAVVLPLTCRYIVRPSMVFLARLRVENETMKSLSPSQSRRVAFLIHTCLLLILVVGAGFAGASVLLAAYLAGTTIAWWDAELVTKSNPVVTSSEPSREMLEAGTTTPTPVSQEQEPDAEGDNSAEANPAPRRIICDETGITGLVMYQHYYFQAVERILKPFFFVSYIHTIRALRFLD